MLHYKPTEFEEFVSKLAQNSVTPPPQVWTSIEDNLNSTAKVNLRVIYTKLSLAAGFALLLSISTYLYFGNSIEIEKYSSNDEINAMLNSYGVTAKNNPKQFAGFISTENNVTVENAEKKLNVIEKIEESSNSSLKSSLNDEPFSSIKFKGLPEKNGNIKLSGYATSSKILTQSKRIVETQSKWSFSASISPTYTKQASYNVLNSSNVSSGLWLWSGEIAVKRRVSKRFSVQAGLNISPMGQKSNNLVLAYSKEPRKSFGSIGATTQYGNVGLNNPNIAVYDVVKVAELTMDKSIIYTNANLVQQFYYLNIPFILSTNFNRTFRNITLKTGFSAGYLIGNEFTLKSELGSFSGQTDINHRYALTAIGALEYSYRVTKNLNLIFEPTVNFNFVSVNNNSQNSLPVTFNLKFGVGF
jgi:hypothetical protein